MPSEKLVPYKFNIHEYRNPDHKYDLTQLRAHDTAFDKNHFFDLIESSFLDKQGQNLEPSEKEKTFIIEEYQRSENVIEGIISTGYHGYEAEIRDADSGDVTHTKQETEAEQMPLYFLIYLPNLQGGGQYDSGYTAFFVLHQVNRIGIKGQMKKHIENYCLSGVPSYTIKMEPVATKEVLQKIISCDRILKLDINTHIIPGDDERKMELIKRLSNEEINNQSLVLRPDHGKSLEVIRRIAQEIKSSETHFGELVSDKVENLTVSIEKDGGREETFSLLNEEVAMRKDLDSEELQTDSGLIKADELRSKTNEMMNNILEEEIVEPLSGTTNVER